MKELILENPPRKLKRKRYATRKDNRHRFQFSGFSVNKNPMKRSRRSRSRRRHSRRSFFGVRSNPAMSGIFTRDNLAIAGGAVGASLVSNLVVSKANRFLPGVNTALGRTGYNVGIPILAAILVRKWAPNIAKGMIIGGLANGIGQIVTATNLLPTGGAIASAPSAPSLTAPVAPTGEYLGEYLGAYAGMDTVSAAFSTDAWAGF